MPASVPLRRDFDARHLRRGHRWITLCPAAILLSPQKPERLMKELGEIVETGPDPAVDGVVRWRRIDLKRVIEARFGVIYSERGISRLLGELGAHISARPQSQALQVLDLPIQDEASERYRRLSVRRHLSGSRQGGRRCCLGRTRKPQMHLDEINVARKAHLVASNSRRNCHRALSCNWLSNRHLSMRS